MYCYVFTNEIFLTISLNAFCRELFRKKRLKMIGRLRDGMGQSYPIYASTRANHARYLSVHVTFCDSWMHSLLK